MKGGHGHGAYSSRKKWMNMYVVMVIVCGCVILGLMGLDTLKERRFLNHLIKQKDDQILSLHILFQKEKEQMQEVKKKTEEMKTKIFSLRTQKTELNGRVLDMQSTISSLRDEQNTIQTAYLQKQHEVKLLRQQYMQIKDHNPQVQALTQALRLREAEIQDLKHRLQFHGATDQHSIISANVSAEANTTAENSTSERNIKQGFKRLENSKETRSENGGSETGVEKKLELQENEHRIRWKQGSLKRTKGKRWRQISKQTEANNSLHINGASTMGHNHDLVEESGHKDQLKNQDEIQNSIIGLRMQNESVSKNQLFEIDDKQSREHKITRADNNEDGQHDNRLRRKQVADDVRMETFEESEQREDREEKLQTDELEF